MLLLQPVADALLVHDAKAVFYAIKEEDSGHFVTLTKRMFTPKFGSHLIAIFVMRSVFLAVPMHPGWMPF